MKDVIVTAKKRFGQNFLKDEVVLQKIVEAMPKNNNKIVEIGPGLGDLTKFLVNVKSVEAFEVDTDLCKRLYKRFKEQISSKQLHINCGDVLQSWKNSLILQPYDLIANLPYYIATNIVLKALADPMCKSILVMVQREVALKFTAKSMNRKFSALSVITQSVADASIIIEVPPTAFEPMPKVDSSVILIQKYSDARDKKFQEMLRGAFTQPRKTLMKNLSSYYDKTMLIKLFNELNILHSIRPHQLSTSDYHQLYKKLNL